MESVEASGKSIEDAILQALARLGRNRDEVEITVLQEPSRGTRGIGAHDARVRVYLKVPRPNRAPAASIGELDGEEGADFYGDNGAFTVEETGSENELYDEGVAEEGFVVGDEITTAPLHEVLPEDASIEEMAVAALRVILAQMGIRAGVEVVEVPEVEGVENDEEPITLNIRSDDPGTLSLLIGKRGDTLSSLQLLVSLIVAKQTGARERIIVDAESYRERREHNLRAMAQRIAQQVRRSGHPVTLEAMPPNERRIIHMALAESSDISTESTGEGDQRRVVVSLKRGVRA
ncbi:MAG TPA: RNA-binding cell elongation regulator Jag/EloR [Ktedonobacterales bacterium]|nr:RNA-binding cell elongation regulator Jag/EloR [Ktedonobacterales bacterium]